MRTITLLLYTAAAVCFLLATLGVAGRINLIPLGLLAWITVPLLQALDAMDQH